METYQLSKSDWNNLNKLGLVDGVGNGFANTTDKFDNNIICGANKPTFIQVKQTIFAVQYISGCFYPIWKKVYHIQPNYTIDKNGEIVRK